MIGPGGIRQPIAATYPIASGQRGSRTRCQGRQDSSEPQRRVNCAMRRGKIPARAQAVIDIEDVSFS